MKLVRSMAWMAVAVLVGGSCAAQTAAWTVKPEWVRAHEEFLASDAMQGRGSATHDEEVTATYVASEFMGYGLKTAPGMESYVQSAELTSTVLNGHSVLTVGDEKFQEGKDFDLLLSPGVGRSGRTVRISATDTNPMKDLGDEVVELTDVPSDQQSMEATRALRRTGAATVIVPEDASTDKMLAMFGGKPRIPLALKGDKPEGAAVTVIAMYPEAYKRMLARKSGEQAVLTLFGTHTDSRKTYNAVGYLQGSDPGAGTLLLSAHLDHLGMGKPINGDGIWNGANDDAAGTTAVLELAHALAAGPQPRRSILFVCYGSEELGEYGSRYFGAHSPVPLKGLVANLEFEMIGNQDPKMPKGVLLLTGWERSNLGPALKEHGALLGPDPYPEQHFFERSDNYQLALQGVVAHTAAGWGTVPTYHQPDDDLAHLDLPFMTAAIQSLIEPVRWLASSDFVPKWKMGGQPKR